MSVVPLCLCALDFTDGSFKWFDGTGYCAKWTVNSDNECDIHCGFFSAFGAMMGEDGSLSFKAEGDPDKFETEVKERFAELSSRVVYNKDGIVAIADKHSRYGLVYVGKLCGTRNMENFTAYVVIAVCVGAVVCMFI